MDWRTTVTDFQSELQQQEGLHSVKDLCNGLLHQFGLETQQEVLAYLQDFLAVSRAHQDFHRAWEKIPNMRNIADYDAVEIATVEDLIQRLLTVTTT